MIMSRSFYLFIVLLLSVNIWGLLIVEKVFNSVTNPVFAAIWAFMGIYWFRTQVGNSKNYAFLKYNKYFFWLVVAFSLSVVSANVFWNQNWSSGIIVNRFLIWYIFLPMLLYIQPKEEEIIRALTYYSIGYIIVWTFQAVTPYPIYSSLANSIELGRGRFELAETDFGQLLPGYPVILFLLYYKTQQMKVDPTLRNTLFAFALMIFFFLLQNRGALFVAVIIFAYTLFTIHSRYRILLIAVFVMLLSIGYFYSAEYWNALLQETIEQFNDPFANRWRSFNYFVFEYSPHWLCSFIGNGMLSANVPAGEFIQNLMDEGYYQYDNGIVGFWSQYGIIPLLVLYIVISRILLRRVMPFYMKAIAIHILIMPIAWNFGSADILILVILIYLYAYYNESQGSEKVEYGLNTLFEPETSIKIR